NSSSLTSPRLRVPSALTCASSSARRSSGTSSPSSSALIRIESSPLFLPSTIERSAATRSDEYGSIDGGSWNWLATAPLSRCRREPEVVVAVEADRHVRTDPLDRAADQLCNRLRRGDPQRVDDSHLLRAGLDRALVDLLVEVGLRTRRVDPEERGVDSVLGG